MAESVTKTSLLSEYFTPLVTILFIANSKRGLLHGINNRLESFGAKQILLEAVPPEVTQQIRKRLSIPVASIGAGPADIQLIICSDLLGLFPSFRPKFASCYVPKVLDLFNKSLENRYISPVDNINNLSLKEYGQKSRKDGLFFLAELAIKEWIKDVQESKFPSKEECYNLKKEDLDKLKQSQMWRIENE